MALNIYRIAKTQARARDLSGIGSFKYGGRWNSAGTYMVYCSMNSSLAYLENLVHFDETEVPPHLFITTINIVDEKLIYTLPDHKYPTDWQVQDNLENKLIGDRWIQQNKFIGYKVRSAINPTEYNYLLNPTFRGFNDQVIITDVKKLNIDARLVK